MTHHNVRSPTPKELEVLASLYRFRKKHGYSPSLEELGKLLAISKVTVYQYVRSLEKKGLITRLRNRARSIQIVNHEKWQEHFEENKHFWNLVGHFQSAGKIHFYPKPRKIDPDILFRRYKKAVLIRYYGESFEDPSIRNGDYLVLEPMGTEEVGKLALIQDAAGKIRLSHLIRKKGKLYYLAPFEPPELKLVQTSDILGIVVGLLRNY